MPELPGEVARNEMNRAARLPEAPLLSRPPLPLWEDPHAKCLIPSEGQPCVPEASPWGGEGFYTFWNPLEQSKRASPHPRTLSEANFPPFVPL